MGHYYLVPVRCSACKKQVYRSYQIGISKLFCKTCNAYVDMNGDELVDATD